MIAYGTNVVGGVTPGKGGARHLDRPVFNTVKEAVRADGRRRRASCSCRRRSAPTAIMEAADAGIRLVVRDHRRHPGAGHDDGEALPAALPQGASARCWSVPTAPASSAPGKAMLGIMPGHIYKRGNVGWSRRSGTLGYEAAAQMKDLGIGMTTSVGIGGDPINGSSFLDISSCSRRIPRPRRS